MRFLLNVCAALRRMQMAFECEQRIDTEAAPVDVVGVVAGQWSLWAEPVTFSKLDRVSFWVCPLLTVPLSG